MAEPHAQADCRKCRAFFITHDPRWPYGCRTFSMRTRGLPSAAVLESSGLPCGGFDPKERPSDPERRRSEDGPGWQA